MHQDRQLQSLQNGTAKMYQDHQLHRLQDGADNDQEDRLLQGLPNGKANHHQACALQSLQLREANLCQEGSVHGLQAGALSEDDPYSKVCAEEGCLYCDSLRAQGDIQAGSGYRVLSVAMWWQNAFAP